MANDHNVHVLNGSCLAMKFGRQWKIDGFWHQFWYLELTEHNVLDEKRRNLFYIMPIMFSGMLLFDDEWPNIYVWIWNSVPLQEIMKQREKTAVEKESFRTNYLHFYKKYGAFDCSPFYSFYDLHSCTFLN